MLNFTLDFSGYYYASFVFGFNLVCLGSIRDYCVTGATSLDELGLCFFRTPRWITDEKVPWVVLDLLDFCDLVDFWDFADFVEIGKKAFPTVCGEFDLSSVVI